MSYAELPAVLGRAGAAGGYFTDSSDPDLSDVERFLVQTASEIDVAIAAINVTVPITDAVAVGALEGLNADGALVLALEAAFPGKGQRPDAIGAILEGARARWTAGIAALMSGKAPLCGYLTNLQGASGPGGATAFWIEEPDYGAYGSRSTTEYLEHPALMPRVSVLERF